VGNNDTHNKINAQAYQVFFFASLLKPVTESYEAKIHIDQDPNAPAAYLAKPIPEICFTHNSKLRPNILKTTLVLINGEMLWQKAGTVYRNRPVKTTAGSTCAKNKIGMHATKLRKLLSYKPN